MLSDIQKQLPKKKKNEQILMYSLGVLSMLN